MLKEVRDNKGFTLIELLAAITILIILMSIIIPSILSLIGRTNDSVLEKKYKILENAAYEYVSDNFNKTIDGTCYIPVEDLTKYGYVVADGKDISNNGYLKDSNGDFIKGYIERTDPNNTPLDIDDDVYKYVSSIGGSLCETS